MVCYGGSQNFDLDYCGEDNIWEALKKFHTVFDRSTVTGLSPLALTKVLSSVHPDHQEKLKSMEF